MEKVTDTESLKRWWQEHSELDQLVEDVQSAMAQGSSQSAGTALEELSEALDAHFTVEENVYFPLIEKVSPRHSPALQGVRQGHQKIRETLEDLRDLIERAQFTPAKRTLALLLDHFHEHEVAETSLINDL